MPIIDEKDIALRISRGDPVAFENLFNEYYGPLIGFFRRRGLALETSEDLAQEVFVNVWKRREHLDKSKSIRGYLYAAAYNNFKMHLRSKAVRDAHKDEMMAEEDNNVFFPKEEFDVNDHINQAIQDLPEAHRAVFVMHRYDGLSYKEIAHILDLAPKTIEGRMSKALKALRIALQHLLFWILVTLS